MNQIPDVCVFMRRVGPFHEEQMASIARHTKQSFNLIYVYEPDTTSYQATNMAIGRSTSQWLVIMDDDVVFLDDGWLQTLIDVMKRNPSLGMVSPMELKTDDAVDRYQQNRDIVRASFGASVYDATWLAGYVMVFNRAKVPDIRCDENLPGRVQMADVDLSLQVRYAGHRTGLTSLTYVKHPAKSTDEEWLAKHDFQTHQEDVDIHNQQVAYMKKKWGAFYDKYRKHDNLGIVEPLSYCVGAT